MGAVSSGIVPIGLSSAALLVAGYAAWEFKEGAEVAQSVSLSEVTGSLLQARLEELEQGIQRLQETMDAYYATTRVEATVEQAAGMTDVDLLLDRITYLEHLASPRAILASEPDASRKDSALARLEEELRASSIEDALAKYQSQFLDRDADERIRIETLAMLRMFPPGLNPVNDRIVNGVFRLAQHSGDPEVRQRALYALQNTDDENVVHRLLDIFASDPAGNVRAEAARVLRKHLHLPAVEAALRRALNVDQDPRVQKSVRYALGLPRESDH